MELTLGVTMAVLGAGLLHAGWNALLKSSKGGDALLDTAAVVVGASCWALVTLPLVGTPERAAWPYIAASCLIHFGYYVTLAQAYRKGDLSFAYPLMRGTAPLLVTVLGTIFLRELPGWQMVGGILLISLGIVSIAFVQRRPHSATAASWAFANAAIIAVYTLVDGAGARASGNAISYVGWLSCLEGIPFLLWVLARRKRPALGYLRAHWKIGLIGGAFSLAAYGIVLWAMTQAPIAAVAALRETSVIFAALIGSIWLKEGFGWRRVVGAVSVAAGIATLKL